MKSSKTARLLSKKAWGEVDDLLGAVSNLCLCPSARSAVAVCSRIRGGRERPKFAKTSFGSRLSKSLGLAHGPLPAE